MGFADNFGDPKGYTELSMRLTQFTPLISHFSSTSFYWFILCFDRYKWAD